MSKKQINATLYVESKIVYKKNERNIVISDPDGYLFAHRKYSTKILPSDLPEWIVYTNIGRKNKVM